MKKTKIVCTIGPASESKQILKKLFLNGLNVCRLNFSHGTHEEHQMRIDNIKAVREELDMPIGIMLDTKGPEIRLGDFKDGVVEIKEGDEFTFTTRNILGDKTICSVTYIGLGQDLKIGNKILVDDGLVEFEVHEIIGDTEIKTIALNDGTLKNHKGVNIPNVKISLPAVTEKDKSDIVFGIKNKVDFIAASFVRKAQDVLEIRKILEDNNGEYIEIISKIENQEGVDNIDEILNASDGIMVARGDLGVEINTEEMPMVQKDLIKRCNIAGKSVITATQMLDSMIRNPRPTRAEVTDVANAIIDGSSCIMLSGETAAGKYPVEAVETMYRIAIRTEKSLDYYRILNTKYELSEITTTNAIGKATCNTAMDLEATAIITSTSSGYTSKAISKFRPKTPIIAATTTRRVMRRLSLVWGVYPVLSPYSDSTDDVIELSIEAAIKEQYVKEGDLVVITAGIPVGTAGSTNLIKVHTIGKILVKGSGIGKETKVGKVCIANNAEELEERFEDGDIIVSRDTDRDMVEYMQRALAIVTEQGGLTSHAAIVGLHLGKPTIVGATDATKLLKHGEIITADSSSGLIYRGEAKVL